MFGSYIAGAAPNTRLTSRNNEQVACVQVKCAGDVADGSDVTLDVATHVDLTIVHKRATCKFR